MPDILDAVARAVVNLDPEHFTKFIAALTQQYARQNPDPALQDGMLALTALEQILQCDKQLNETINARFAELGRMTAEDDPPPELASYAQAWVLWVAAGYFLRRQISRLHPDLTQRVRDFIETQERNEYEVSEAVLRVLREVSA